MKALKARAILATSVGVVLLAVIFAVVGLSPVIAAVRGIGVDGFAAFCASWLLVLAVLGLAWFTATPGLPLRRAGAFIWGRVVRESAADILPFSQVGGLLVGAGALLRSGLSEALVFASMIVDLTAEMGAQVIYTLGGVGALLWVLAGRRGDAPVLWSAVGGLVLILLATIAFALVQRRGPAWVGAVAERWLPGSIARGKAVGAALDDIYGRRGRVLLAVFLHLLGWIGSGVVSWIALTFMGAGIPLWAVLAIESLMHAVRSIGFMIPGALGVQEGAYVLLGPLFGLHAGEALALSLIKRGRDLLIGVPTLLVWQAREGRRMLGAESAGE